MTIPGRSLPISASCPPPASPPSTPRTPSIFWVFCCSAQSQFPLGKPVFTGAITAPAQGPTPQYGEYILSYSDCRECHGAQLHGGVVGQLGPIGPDLNVVKAWTRAGFIATMRTGKDPYGHEISPQMPWRPIGMMSDDELSAIYEYLERMPEVETAAN